MKLVSLALITGALAGKLNSDGYKCEKIGFGEAGWELINTSDGSKAKHDNKRECIKAKCDAMSTILDGYNNADDDNDFWNYIKKNFCDSNNFDCDAQKYGQGLGVCGMKRDCQAQLKGDKKCVPQQCKFRTPIIDDVTNECSCGTNTNCMCKGPAGKKKCQATKNKRYAYCFQTDKDFRLIYPELRLEKGWVKYGQNVRYWLGQNLGYATDGNGQDYCTWSGTNVSGRNYADQDAAGDDGHAHPVKWYAAGDGLCCKGSYVLRCASPNRRDNGYAGNEGGCHCLDGYTKQDGETNDSKKHKRVICSFNGRPAPKGDGSGGTYTQVDPPVEDLS